MLYTLRFFSSKCSLFCNANFFGPYIIHILYTGCAKIKKKLFWRQSVKVFYIVPKPHFQTRLTYADPSNTNDFSIKTI